VASLRGRVDRRVLGIETGCAVPWQSLQMNVRRITTSDIDKARLSKVPGFSSGWPFAGDRRDSENRKSPEIAARVSCESAAQRARAT
jgi:hypothetical protein